MQKLIAVSADRYASDFSVRLAIKAGTILTENMVSLGRRYNAAQKRLESLSDSGLLGLHGDKSGLRSDLERKKRVMLKRYRRVERYRDGIDNWTRRQGFNLVRQVHPEQRILLRAVRV